MSLERCIKLSCRNSGGFQEVRDTLVVFLEEFREAELQEKIVLTIDVTEMPLFVDIKHLREIVDVLTSYRDCFKKVARLKITVAQGVQEMIVRGTVGLMPFPFPIDVHVRSQEAVREAGV
jgi:hypothetical protein